MIAVVAAVAVLLYDTSYGVHIGMITVRITGCRVVIVALSILRMYDMCTHTIRSNIV
jgi:hypothetical protein